LAYMSKTKRARVRKKRILTLVIIVAIVAGGIFSWQTITSGKTMASVNGKKIKTGIVNGVAPYANEYVSYSMFWDDLLVAYGVTTEDDGASQTEEEIQAEKDRVTLQQYSTLINICIPYEVMKQHFEEVGIDALSQDAVAGIDSYVASVFTVDKKEDLYEHGVKERHVKYYCEYETYWLALMDEVEEADPITDEDREEYYETNISQFTTPMTWEASHILIKDEEHTQEGREKIEGILERIRAGEDFATLADEYTEDTGTGEGGSLGSFGEGSMVTEFEDAVKQLEIGEVSDVVETQYGYHIIKLTGINEEEISPMEDNLDTIDYAIGAERTSDYLDELTEAANIVYMTLIDPETGEPPLTQDALDVARGTSSVADSGGGSY